MAGRRTGSATELLVDLRRDRSIPLHRQLEHELRAAVRAGRLSAGSVLPSTRALARQLGLSRGVIVEAYEQLVAEGYLVSRAGGTTTVAARAAGPTTATVAGRDRREHRLDFRYGRPDVTQFPRAAWLRSLRRVLTEAPSERLSYLDRRGSLELRTALAEYLNRVRGTAADPDRMVICNGFAQALFLLTQVLRTTGRRRLAVEVPGVQDVVYTASQTGVRLVRIEVDEAGLDVGALARTDADAVLVTPAHQFPTGAVLAPDRRAGIIAWATAHDRLILEDDYDAEFRYDREPIGALHGLAPEQVIYAGSASKTLAPGLRLGWLLVPERLVDHFAAAKEATDRGSASLEQLAFADFLGRGEFDHHLRRMRPIYRRRRDAMLDALRRHLPGARPVGASAGLHILAWLPDGVDEAALVRGAAARGVGVDGMAPYHGGRGGPPGLLLGYGTLTVPAIEEGIRILGSVAASSRPS
ncbi:MAG TPA: PLP-dependent aminotransferase family protein [Candidatus Limnocylindrales bacterium]